MVKKKYLVCLLSVIWDENKNDGIINIWNCDCLLDFLGF